MIFEIGPLLACVIVTFLTLDTVRWYLYHFHPDRREDTEVQHIIHEERITEGGHEHVS